MYRTVGSPGSQQAISDRKRAAWPCRLVELPFCGVYLPAELLLQRPVLSGWIVSIDSGVGERTSTFLTSLSAGDSSPINPLTVHLGEGRVRQNQDGTYLLHGTAWDAVYLSRWPQAWLCGPGTEVVTAALKQMSAWLQRRYTGQFGMWR